MLESLCLACSSTIPDDARPASILIHSCCSRPVCATCLSRNPRLATFCPICENATTAFTKGPRPDVTRAGQVVFDADGMFGIPPTESASGVAGIDESPPSYDEAVEGTEPNSTFNDRKPDFVIDDEDDEVGSSKAMKAKQRSGKVGPELLLRQTSKTLADAELDVTGSSSASRASGSSSRVKVDPHSGSNSHAAASSAREGDGQTRQYWLRKEDTLQSIAIRFGISSNELCLLNSLPRAVLSSSPHLLHTRSFILLPAHAVEKQLASNPEIASALEGPPQKSPREKTITARRAAEAKFRAILSRNAATSNKTRTDSETPADEKAARAYIGLAEDELRTIDFGEGADEVGLPLPYDKDVVGDGKNSMIEEQMDTARAARFDAILTHAVARWEMDSDWERSQRAKGCDPGSVSHRLPSSSSAASSIAAPSRTNSQRNSVGAWFTRALSGNPHHTQALRQGELTSPSGSESKPPRRVAALSSSIKLPTSLQQSFEAHKGPVNVARYNSTGRYILSGGSDRTVRLWNAKTGGEVIKTYTEHTHEVLALDISADNSRFASGGGDKNVFVWDVSTGSILRRFSGHAGKINDVRFGGRDGDGSVVVAGGFDGVVRVFDLRAQGAWRPIMEMKEAKDAITSIHVRDGSIFTGSVDGVLRCYDLRSGDLRSDTVDAPITSVSASASGTSVLVSTLDSTHRLFDTRDGTCLQSFTGHQQKEYRCKAVLTNKEDAVIAGDEQGKLYGWDLVSAEPLSVGPKDGSAPHSKAILWVEQNPDKTGPIEIVSAGADGVVKVWGMDGS